MDRATAHEMKRRRRLRHCAAALCTVPVLLAGCGDDGGETTDTTDTTMPATTTTVEPQRYTVEPGDTLSEIADRFDTSLEALIDENDISDPDLIRPGDELVIPTGAEQS